MTVNATYLLCTDCDVRWNASESRTCWSCGGAGQTERDVVNGGEVDEGDVEHWAEVNRLWLRIRRDMPAAIEQLMDSMNVVEEDRGAFGRLVKNWLRLYELDREAAQRVRHGLSELAEAIAVRPELPAAAEIETERQATERRKNMRVVT